MQHGTSIFSSLRTLDISELIFPRLCTGCTEPLLQHETNFCLLCEQQLPLTRNWEPSSIDSVSLFKDQSEIDTVHALLHYQKGGMVQSMLRRLKYDGAKDVGISLGEKFGKLLAEYRILEEADGLVAVPLHPAKLLRRGYNQSDMIIRGLREHLEIPDMSHLLKRKLYTESQTSKSRYDRFQNMDHVFECPVPKKAEGLHLIVVDDVITTGSTMRSCLNVLTKAGAEKLSVLSLAIA